MYLKISPKLARPPGLYKHLETRISRGCKEYYVRQGNNKAFWVAANQTYRDVEAVGQWVNEVEKNIPPNG